MNQKQNTALTIAGILVAVLVIFSVVGFFWGWQRGGFGMMDQGMMRGFGSMFLVAILWIVVLGLIIWAVVAALHRSGESDSTLDRADSPMEILKRRYAQGEIDKEEYEAKKKDLA